VDESHRGSKAASAAQTAERRPKGTNSAKAVWIIPSLGTIHKTASQSGAFLCIEFRCWMRTINLVRPTATAVSNERKARARRGQTSLSLFGLFRPVTAFSLPENKSVPKYYKTSVFLL